jgi:4-carboxymuconolactone decarboxylase
MIIKIRSRLQRLKKGRAATLGHKEIGERRMAKAPPSAKRDRIKAFTPALVDYTNDVVYGDLWERPGLSKRDRSLVTVAALIASGQVAQITFHLNRAMDNGLTQNEAAEMISHLAFYAGWPNAMSALPVAKEIFAKRAQPGAAR